MALPASRGALLVGDVLGLLAGPGSPVPVTVRRNLPLPYDERVAFYGLGNETQQDGRALFGIVYEEIRK